LATIPGATSRNWASYGSKVQINDGVNMEEALKLLPDPQTNGGLLVATNDVAALKEVFSTNNLTDFLTPIGKCIPKKEKVIYVEP
jgi:selenide, water dikinase